MKFENRSFSTVVIVVLCLSSVSCDFGCVPYTSLHALEMGSSCAVQMQKQSSPSCRSMTKYLFFFNNEATVDFATIVLPPPKNFQPVSDECGMRMARDTVVISMAVI